MDQRALKRVPMDFRWPLEEVWSGYKNPHDEVRGECPACGGSGFGPEAQVIADQWYGEADFDPAAYGAKPLTLDHPGVVAYARRNLEHSPSYYGRGELALQRESRRLFELWRGQWCHHLIQEDVDALVADDRLWNFTHTARTDAQRAIVKAQLAAGENSWLREPNGFTPTADEVNAWSLTGMGHDAINRFTCIKARCKREGVAYLCSACGGDGEAWPSPEVKAQAKAWEPSEPPTGEGFQLWETTTEGSPVSPVFASLSALCAWCEKNATVVGPERATAAEWEKMLAVPAPPPPPPPGDGVYAKHLDLQEG